MSVGTAAGRAVPPDPGVTRLATGGGTPDETGNWQIEVSFVYSDGQESLPSVADTINITGPNDAFHIPLPIGDARVTKRSMYFKKPSGTFHRPGFGLVNDNTTASADFSAQVGAGTAPQSSAANYPIGSTYLYVADTARFTLTGGTVTYAGGSFTYTSTSTSSGVGALLGIPSAGAGSIGTAIAVGDSLNDVRPQATFAATSTLGFSTVVALAGRATFACDSSIGLTTTSTLRGVSRFAADSTIAFLCTASFSASAVTFTINGVDVTVRVRKYESEIIESQHEGAAKAYVVVRGITPVEGQEVVISDGFGTIFDGQITEVQLIKTREATRARYRLVCDQWGDLMDRRLVYDKRTTTAISTLVTSFLGLNTSGFTTANVETISTTTDFNASGDRMTSVLIRLAGLVNAVFRILPTKDVYFRANTNLTAPAALTSTNHLYRNLVYRRNKRLVRTRVFAKGASVSVLADVLTSMLAVPIASITMFVGGILIMLDGLKYNCSTYLAGGTGSTLSSSAATGATTLNVTDTNSFPSPGWALLNGVYVYWGSKTNGTPGTLTSIPASGAGSVTSAMPSGASIVTVPTAVVQPSNAALASGASAQLIVQRDDTAAQTALAALEGGDGIYEFEVEDTGINSIGALQALGDAELTAGKSVIESATFTSEDRNAQVGATQVINVAGISASIPITNTRIYFVADKRRPQRDVTAAAVQKTLYQFLTDLHDASLFTGA